MFQYITRKNHITANVLMTYLSTEVMTSCQVLKPEETVPHASATTARVLMNHLSQTYALIKVVSVQNNRTHNLILIVLKVQNATAIQTPAKSQL